MLSKDLIAALPGVNSRIPIPSSEKRSGSKIIVVRKNDRIPYE